MSGVYGFDPNGIANLQARSPEGYGLHSLKLNRHRFIALADRFDRNDFEGSFWIEFVYRGRFGSQDVEFELLEELLIDGKHYLMSTRGDLLCKEDYREGLQELIEASFNEAPINFETSNSIDYLSI